VGVWVALPVAGVLLIAALALVSVAFRTRREGLATMGKFLEAEKPRQSAFKAGSAYFSEAARAEGFYRGKRYPFCLPQEGAEENLFSEIRTAALGYFKQHGITWHDGTDEKPTNHLCGSQVCCVNFLFPPRKDLEEATSILAKAIPGLRRVERIEFEYTGPESATEWLGEPPGGKRGQNRTSIDAAVWWRGPGNKTRLTLVEWKYTEPSFGKCGGDRSAGKDQQPRCDTLKVQDIRPKLDCYVASGEDAQTSRHYWEHLVEAGISVERFGDHLGCPFRGPFYQLMRQYLLAAYCRANLSGVDNVDVIVIGFRNNRDLLRVPRHLAHLGQDVESAWNNMLTTAPPLRHVFVETMLAGAPSDDWREYIRERYGV
jgi:hypothetical protein